MRSKVIFFSTLAITCLAIWGIFNLIFTESSEMMVWCIVSGIAMSAALLSNLLVVSSTETNTVRNASLTWVLNASGIAFFAWTLFFVFLLGSYEDGKRPMTTLYVGYLIILIACVFLTFMGGWGGSISEKHSQEVQASIQGRDVFIMQLKQAIVKLEEIETDARTDNHKALAKSFDFLKNIPANRISDPTVSSQLSEKINSVIASVEQNDAESISTSIRDLVQTLKAVRL